MVKRKWFFYSKMNLQIELTNICNFDCIYCPRPLLNRKPEYMKLEIFKKIYDIFKSDIRGIIINKDGEPFLHNNIKEIIEYIEPNKIIRIPTNGVFMNNDIVDFLISRQNKIKLVLTEHILGRKPQEEIVIKTSRKNAEYLINKRKNNITIQIIKNYINGKDNQEKDFINFYTNLGIKPKINKDIDMWCDSIHFNNNQKRKKCRSGHKQVLMIGVTGNMLLCCNDLNEEYIIGNVLEENKIELMKKRDIIFNRINIGDWDDIKPCNRCLRR